MKKLLIVLTLMIMLSIGLFTMKPVQADATLTPATSNITWSITSPAANVFVASSPYFNVGVTDTAYTFYWTNKISDVVNQVGTVVTLRSTTGGYNLTTRYNTIDGYLNTLTNYLSSDYQSVTYYADTEMAIQLTFSSVDGYTSSALVNTYLENNFNVYEYATLAPAFAVGDNESYWNGYNTAQEIYYTNGLDDMYNNGANANGYDEADSYDYNKGLYDLYTDGSTAVGLDEVNSYDYIAGANDQASISVNAGTISFMDDLKVWIVPAIVVVILLGGFISMAALKKRGD